MRAVVFTAEGQLSLEERPTPTPGFKEILIATAAVGICGTDTHVLDGEFEGTIFPLVPGHEATGTIVALGEGVNSGVFDFQIGDHVAVNPSTTCGECEYCQNGHQNLCRFWNGLGVVASDGAAQQFFTAPAGNVHRLRPDTDLFEAALIEPLACAIRGWDVLPRRLGDHVLVYGAGTMGLLMAQLAHRAGAATVTIVDLNEARLQTAAECGIELRYTSADHARRDKWDVVIDCTGSIAAIEDALTRVKPAGFFQDFGVAPADRSARFSPFRVYRDEISIVGTMAVLNSFGRAVELFEAGAINAAAMISHSFTLDDYESALDMFRRGEGRKLQIRPNDTASRVLR
ncbi:MULTISPECIES: zinc-dependent alcohol dehydrogenase family protein [unclassified Microbacterium]|uniref:zinc-dependent alcohol dehydrogenase family protein n=1 Tax=unclassified Microbacterium TaxID=2609290 RepID=UPI0016050CC9|nr:MULTISPECIES: zinc-dependent alcohol dehydrogenase family protein [unclassified Microbacterium]QNA93377.1 zinc-dependent alcohol dehydrogenase family protein [Microbacterium sp. Se63.02b]QYM63604.1 zinc-dependent alcohol dehydrogenase family protein [Microbacterium sp. Se5.02b]